MVHPREEIIKELSGKPYYMNDRECELLADYVIADRKRVVEPLVYCSKLPNTLRTDRDWPYAARLTLIRAGAL